MAVTRSFSAPTASYVSDGAGDVIVATVSAPTYSRVDIIGNGGADQISGAAGILNVIQGGAGADSISNRSTNATVNGGPGKDSISVTADGTESAINGGRNNDTVRLTIQEIIAGDQTDIDGGGQRDTLTVDVGSTTTLLTHYFDIADGSWGRFVDGANTLMGQITNFESYLLTEGFPYVFRGSDGTDIAHAFGGDDSLAGGGGNDTLSGGRNNDQLYGGGGRDFLLSGQSDGLTPFDESDSDSLFGGLGNDVLFAEDGVSSLFGGGGKDVLIAMGDGGEVSGGVGADHILFRTGSSKEPLPDGLIGRGPARVLTQDTKNQRGINDFEDLIVDGGNGRDTLYFDGLQQSTGWSATPHLVLNFATNEAQLDPSAGGDVFTIRQIEHVIATAFDDVLVGSRRKETFEGARGDDTLTLGGKSDTIIFSSGDGLDRVSDFKPGGRAADRIDLSEAGVRFRDLDYRAVTEGATDPVTGDTAEADGIWVLINIRNGLFLEGVARGQLDADNFGF